MISLEMNTKVALFEITEMNTSFLVRIRERIFSQLFGDRAQNIVTLSTDGHQHIKFDSNLGFLNWPFY